MPQHRGTTAASPSLPYDLIQSHIIPDLLSDHLHSLLVAPVAPSWHAFYTLPLVSFSFRQACQSLYIPMFGLESGEDPSVIDDILSFAQSLWIQAKLPPDASRPVLEYTHTQLMAGGNSLIRIYMCLALSRSFLNYDVLRYIVPTEQGLPASEQGHVDTTATGSGVPMADRLDASRMPDETMHRLFLPLTCAMKLCDSIRPERLGYIVAEYIADIMPLLSTTPLMLKYSQDLRSYIIQEHRVSEETWVKWIFQTLGLIEDTGLLVAQMQATGKLVQSFSRSSSIPCEVLQITNITHVLHDVSRANWGVHSEAIQVRACSILRGWTMDAIGTF